MKHPFTIYREKAGLNQKQLADLLGISPAQVSHIENGKRRVSPQLALVAEAIDPQVFKFKRLMLPTK